MYASLISTVATVGANYQEPFRDIFCVFWVQAESTGISDQPLKKKLQNELVKILGYSYWNNRASTIIIVLTMVACEWLLAKLSISEKVLISVI